MIKPSLQLGLVSIFACLAISSAIVGELSGEFRKIRELAARPQSLMSLTRGEFVTLNNGISFGFDVDSEGNDFLMVKLASNQTFLWCESIHSGVRILKGENFTLDSVDCSFEIDVSVRFYDSRILEIIDNTRSRN